MIRVSPYERWALLLHLPLGLPLLRALSRSSVFRRWLKCVRFLRRQWRRSEKYVYAIKLWKSVKPTEWQWKLKRFLSFLVYCCCHRSVFYVHFGRVMSIISARARSRWFKECVDFAQWLWKVYCHEKFDVINNSAFDSFNSLRQFVSWYFLWPPSTIEPYFFLLIYYTVAIVAAASLP